MFHAVANKKLKSGLTPQTCVANYVTAISDRMIKVKTARDS
jgi:hypothetical protein